jgi:hypothetical protein
MAGVLSARTEAGVGLLSEDRPRQHHYLFAHRELVRIARRFAPGLPELAESGRMGAAMAQTWERIGSQLPAGESLPHEGLKASLHDVGGRSVVLVTLPRPEHGAEAYFVGIVVIGDQLSDYYVLEHSWTTRDEPRTALCKWEDRGHVNLGDGPPAEEYAFLAALQARLGSTDA